MTIIQRLFLGCTVAVLAGCGTALGPKEAPPAAEPAAGERILARYPSDQEKWAIYAVPDSFFGVSTSSRGSVAVGLLLGPIGVAANMAHVRSESERQAEPLKPLLAEDLRKVLAAQAPNATPEAGALPARYFGLVPSATVDFRADDEFRVRCSLNTSLMEGTTVLWSARYLLQGEGAFAPAKAEDVAKARAEIGTCLGRAYGLFQQHKANRLGGFKEHEVVAEYTMNLQLLESAMPDRIIGADSLGFYEWRKSDVKSIKPK